MKNMQKLVPIVEFTPVAKVKLMEVLKEQNAADSYLRIDVSASSDGCACSGGHKYVMELAQQARPGDLIEEVESIKVVTEKKNAEILRGSKIDYTESLQMSGFKIENPNVQKGQGCGCGGH